MKKKIITGFIIYVNVAPRIAVDDIRAFT